jgi:prepilin-type processing-associated H-X9-DG protein
MEASCSAFLCPSDLMRQGDWTNYAGNGGVGVQTYGYNGIFAPEPVGYQGVTDGTSHTSAFAEVVLGETDGTDRRRVVFGTSTLLIRPEELDRFSQLCRGMTMETGRVVGVPRGHGWATPRFSSTLYNHTNPIGANSCMNRGHIKEGAWSAGSVHPGGANVAFADGHVRFLSDGTSLDVWRALGSRNGREPVSDLGH